MKADDKKSAKLLTLFIIIVVLVFVFRNIIGCLCLSTALKLGPNSMKEPITRRIYEMDCQSGLLLALADDYSTSYCQELLLEDGQKRLPFLIASHSSTSHPTNVVIYELIGNVERQHPRSLAVYLRLSNIDQRETTLAVLTDPALINDMTNADREFYSKELISNFENFEKNAEFRSQIICGLDNMGSSQALPFMLGLLAQQQLSETELDSLLISLQHRFLAIKAIEAKQLFLDKLKDIATKCPKSRNSVIQFLISELERK